MRPRLRTFATVAVTILLLTSSAPALLVPQMGCSCVECHGSCPCCLRVPGHRGVDPTASDGAGNGEPRAAALDSGEWCRLVPAGCPRRLPDLVGGIQLVVLGELDEAWLDAPQRDVTVLRLTLIASPAPGPEPPPPRSLA